MWLRIEKAYSYGTRSQVHALVPLFIFMALIMLCNKLGADSGWARIDKSLYACLSLTLTGYAQTKEGECDVAVVWKTVNIWIIDEQSM